MARIDRERFARRAAPLVVGVAALLVAWRLLPQLQLFVDFNRGVLAYPWVVDYDEGVNLNNAYRLSRGLNPYPHETDGFISNPYPPLYILLAALPLRFGPLGLLGGRLIALASTLLVAALAAALVRRETGSWPAGALSGALFLSLTPTIVWGAFYKQDMLALALGLAGLAWLARWPAGARAYGAIPWFALAIGTKQTAVTALAAGGLYLLCRDWRGGLRFGLACAAALAAPALLLEWGTAGGFHRHIIDYHAFPWQAERCLKNLRQLAQFHGPLLALAAVGLLASLPRWRSSVLAWYAPFGLLSLVGNGTVGANFNHLLEALLTCCLLAGALVGRLGARPVRWPRVAGLLAALLLVAYQAPRLGTVEQWFDRRTLPSPGRAERLGRITAMVAQAQGEVLTDDNLILLRAGKPVRYADPSTMGPLAAQGDWDEGRFVAELRARRFALIVLNEEVMRPGFRSTSWTPAMLAALREHYRPLYRDAMFTYAPR